LRLHGFSLRTESLQGAEWLWIKAKRRVFDQGEIAFFRGENSSSKANTALN
jgi:hypothetical protein